MDEELVLRLLWLYSRIYSFFMTGHKSNLISLVKDSQLIAVFRA